jgi:ubiquinone/menaquinone biosynthesis C-methylase UbiE
MTDTLAPLVKAVELAPRDAAAHNNLASGLCAAGRLDEAEASCREALRLRPDFPQAHSNLGVILSGLGRLDEAVASLRRAVELDPALADVRLNLSILLHRLVGNRAGQSLFGDVRQDVGEVRRQYESLPFPPRDPEAERYAIKVSPPDILAKINQYCFGGSRDFTQPFRALVAGCGTGDSVIWLAHQLKDTPAEIVAIDLSETSLAVARERARLRGLDRIRFVHGSLLDVASFGCGLFDYITCLGVLHHLPDPDAGLRALESVLAEGGGMAIMLYGAVGRSHIYSIQHLLRQLTAGLAHPADQLAFAKQIVGNLPPTNDFRRREGAEIVRSVYLANDTNFWDTLMHSQDRAYTASQVREYLAAAGLQAQSFVTYNGNAATTALQYDPDFLIADPARTAHLKTLSQAQREDAAEIIDGSLSLHTVYATRESRAALDPAAPEAILSPMSELARQTLAHLAGPGAEITVALRNGSGVRYRPSPATRAFLARIDGKTGNAAIAESLGVPLSQVELAIPAALHWVTARTRQGTAFQPLPDRNRLTFPLLHSEPSALAV